MLPETVAREIIASHHQRPRNRGARPGAPSATFENPGCGDRVTVWLELEGETISAVQFEGRGCAISQASASLMTAALKGKTLAEAHALADAFRSMVTGERVPVSELAAPELGELMALNGVSRLYARRKCALLPWQALGELLGPAHRPSV